MKLHIQSTDAAGDEASSITDIRRTIHQLNNALTAVIANAQLAHAVLAGQSAICEELTDVVSGASRACELARTLKTLTCGHDERPEADR